jgi:hypothetical protein
MHSMRLGGNYLGQDTANQDLQPIVRRLEAVANEAPGTGKAGSAHDAHADLLWACTRLWISIIWSHFIGDALVNT